MFADLPLLEALRWVATDQEWLAFDLVRNVEPLPLWSHGWPGQEEQFALRMKLQAPLLAKARDKLEAGDWQAEGRWMEGPSYTKIDRRMWPKLEFALEYDRVWVERTRDFYSDILVSEVLRQVTSQRDKEKLRNRVRQWFAAELGDGSPPRSRAEWYALGKERFPGLTDNLFRGIWDELGHPHPLKLEGRPPLE